MNFETKQELVRYLSQFITPGKWQKMQEVVLNRTRYVTVVLEDIYQAHNISASIRSCEAFGLQDIHIVEERNRYNVNIGITKGASDWVDIKRYNQIGVQNTQNCFKKLKEQGYSIVATTPHEQSCELSRVSIDQKVALVFGTELTGLSEYALRYADAYVKIPMYGFTESFNISVSVSLCVYDVISRVRSQNIWQLSQEEQVDILLSWLRRTIRGSSQLENLFLS
ncbi:MAG TPA: RNA methyltransferase [Candidatus Babeliaceae bacterium]|nr:RNA methyltransferase [Candidatus Babeliaceae bacterium]